MALQCHKISSMKRFLSSNIPFRQSDPIKFEIWTLSGCSKQIDQFLRGLFGKQDSVLAQTLHGSSVSQNETPGKVFWFRQFTFLRKESNKIWNLDSFRMLGTTYQFFWAYLESKTQFWPKLCMALQCQKIKLLWIFLVEAIYSSEKRKQ